MSDAHELFIDKDCVVCTYFGKKVLKYSDNIYVKSMEELNPDLQSLDSIILKTKLKTYIGMDAIVKVVGGWEGYYKYINVSKFFPNVVNRFLYKLISKNRHRLSTILNVMRKR